MVQAKQRKPTAYTPELSVWQEGACLLCDMQFTPVRKPSVAQSVTKRHYGGRRHHANEQHAKLMLRTFRRLDDVHDLLRHDYECVCGIQTWWRPMAIHLQESNECLDKMEQLSVGSITDNSDSDEEEGSDDAGDSEDEEEDSGYADDSDAADDSEGTDDSGDEAVRGITQALEMPEEDFWRC